MSTSSGWERLSNNVEASVLKTEILAILRSADKPWSDIIFAPKSPVDVMILNVLQKVSYICFV